jgi:putative ABC transport system permease protein
MESLKGKARSVKGTIRFSRGLMAMQFLIAIFIFTVSVIMGRQVSYFLEKDLGYDNSSLLIVSSVPRQWNSEGFDKMDRAKAEFQRLSVLEGVSLSWGSPSWNFSPMSDRLYAKGSPAESGQTVAIASADEDYADVYSLTIQEGKFIAGAGETRMPRAIVINESAQKALHARVGDVLQLQGGGDQDFVVAGVVKDFHFESLHESVKPVIFMHNRDFSAYRYFSFKLKPGNLLLAVEAVEKSWKQQFPDDPFVYTFSDEKLAALYKTEQQLKKASGIATALMVIIVLTGVIGLVSLSVGKRTKEIGIRKVLGASSSNLLVLLSKEYAWIMGVSFLAGIPLIYYFISEWLSGFAYHINLTAWMFLLPIVMLFVITLMVVALQALRAVFSNPVKALRYE